MVLLDEEEILPCTDARTLRAGSYSAWLKKMKNEGAKARWLSNSTNRYFTIDFDAQIFYYSHSAGTKKISNPIRFAEIQGAERLPPPAKAAKKGKSSQSSGFLLRTIQRIFELHTSSNADAAHWVYALNAARDIGAGAAVQQQHPAALQGNCLAQEAPPPPQHAFVPPTAAHQAPQSAWAPADKQPASAIPRANTSLLDTTVGSVESRGGDGLDTSYCAEPKQDPPAAPASPAANADDDDWDAKETVEVPAAGHAANADASGWDSDKEEDAKSGEKKKSAPEGPAQAQAGDASGWDSDKEEKRSTPPSPPSSSEGERRAKKMPVKLGALVKCEDCDRSFNSESIEKHKRVCKKVFQQKREKFNSAANRLGDFVSNGEMVESGDKVEKVAEKVPDGPVDARPGAEASGFDSDEESKPAAKAAPSAPESTTHKGGVAMEFDFTDGPRKAAPKALAARLSKKKSKKITLQCQDKGAPPLARKKSEPVPSGWDSDEDKKAAPVADTCGAPKQREEAKAFVAAKPSAPAPQENLGGQGELGDLLTEVLSADTAAPFKGSASHGFVPNFHCTACDHEVLRIDRHVWNDDVAYMFLRNNYPNVMKLRPQLKAQDGASAFCCQCSSRSADSSASLEDVAEGLRWRVVQA